MRRPVVVSDKLPLGSEGWIYTEPNPYNPPGNLQAGQAAALKIDLSSPHLPQPRLSPEGQVLEVPAYTDFKLHDICSGPDDPNGEPLDQEEALGSPGFAAGNRKFLTRRLWDSANQAPFFHQQEESLAAAVERDWPMRRPPSSIVNVSSSS